MDGYKLTQEEGKELLRIARSTIQEYLKSRSKPQIQTENPALLEKRGAFVTLKILDRLRGCIGTLEPEAPLYQTVMEMATAAAVRDSRFPALSLEELSQTAIEISVLSTLQKIKRPQEIEVGKHGLYITKGFHRGVLLPQVATEQKWDRQEFLRYLCLKAGLKETDWRKGANIFIFTAQVFTEEPA